MRYFIVILFCILVSHITISQEISSEWTLIKTKENTQVFTRIPANLKLKELRIVATMPGKVEELMEILSNAKTYPNWVYKCTQGELLERIDDQSFYYYVVTDLPFPASDRDLIVLCRQWIDKDGGHSRSEGRPSYNVQNKHYVRIPEYKSSWDVSQVSEKEIKIEFQLLSDPGGNIPKWLVNLVIANGPLKSMKQLASILEK